jgi:hypothetical protein
MMDLIMKKVFVSLTCGFLVTAMSGCSIPTYQKEISSQYDADGKLIGTTVTETIRQPSPHSSSMKVKITQEDLEIE